MSIHLRLPEKLLSFARRDLLRPHAFAHERVGYFKVKAAPASSESLVLCGYDYFPVLDEHYIDDPSVGALVGREGLRAAMQVAYSEQVGLFHTHLHSHRGQPWFSKYDLEQNHEFVPDMFNVAAGLPHGALVFSLDSAAGLCWRQRAEPPAVISKITSVGAPLRFWRRGG